MSKTTPGLKTVPRPGGTAGTGRPSTAATAADRRHMAAVAALGCLICQQPAQVHHIRDGAGMGQRSGHDETIPLCLDHHTGANGIHTIGQQTFEARFGVTEREMLAATLAKLSEEKLTCK